MDSRNFAIGVLVVTAVILLVGLVVVTTLPQRAVASNVSSYGGDFTVTVGKVTRDTELLYVLDNVTQRLLVYVIARKTGEIAITDMRELAALVAP
jgi:hypothetical protein